ncbi:alpha/beta fold hydrolase [Sphingomonas aurantiaca]|uniref:alpha/beta fold hydrolase n=1 Tax=Sphingomonas aurantiaca TaxID=185949 RepID=UPI002FE03A26
MPFAVREAVRLYWKLDGAPDLPVLVLLNSIGTDMALWDTSAPHLLPAFRLLRIDTRGHGASDAPAGDYTLAMLADDVVAVMDAAGVTQAAIAGVSLGGMIAMELGAAASGASHRTRAGLHVGDDGCSRVAGAHRQGPHRGHGRDRRPGHGAVPVAEICRNACRCDAERARRADRDGG